MKELPEKYKRLNKQAFDEAKKEFDKRFGEFFTRETVTRTGTTARKSWADVLELWLNLLVDRYPEGRFSVQDSDRIAPVLLATMFVIDTQMICLGWAWYDGDKEPVEDVPTWHDTDEMLQASRIRQLFLKLVATALKMAHEIKSDTYQQWRELYIYASEHISPLGEYCTGEETYATHEDVNAVANILSVFNVTHRKLWADLQIMGKANAPKLELGEWAKRFVADYDAKHGYVGLTRGQQRSFIIPKTSAKAWDILTRLFTANDPEGWTKLPPNWKSHFIRKIGSTSEIDKDSDLVKIAAFIRPHTPGKGRASDGKYRFEPVRLVRENLK